jgi:hypothetical protein
MMWDDVVFTTRLRKAAATQNPLGGGERCDGFVFNPRTVHQIASDAVCTRQTTLTKNVERDEVEVWHVEYCTVCHLSNYGFVTIVALNADQKKRKKKATTLLSLKERCSIEQQSGRKPWYCFWLLESRLGRRR